MDLKGFIKSEGGGDGGGMSKVVKEGSNGYPGFCSMMREWHSSFQGGEIMRKGFVVLLAALVVAMFAMPAMAGTEVSGLYRAKGYVSNFKELGAASTTPDRDDQEVTNEYVEQRIRMKFAFGEENVKAVWFAELDPNWGIGNFNNLRNQGGGLGADGINIETKNAYVWFKVPNTTWEFTVGLQNVSDSYAGVLFGYADMAGAFATFKYDPVAFRIGYANWFEGDVSQDDDIALYLVEAKFSPVKEVKLGLNFYYIRDAGTGDDESPTAPLNADDPIVTVYVPGFDLAFKVGPATISGFFLYEFGQVDEIPGIEPEIDISGFAADVRADMNLGPGKFFIEGLYVSGDDDPSDNDFESIFTAGDVVGSQDYFARTDMQILLSNLDDLSTNQPLTTNVNFRGTGRGIWHIAAGYSQKLTDKLSGKIGVGYMAVTEEFPGDQGSQVGTEINANVNYNIAKGLDFGLYGAYAFLGDFFDQPAGSPELVDPYDLHFRLNYAF
jgi:hypothetical protein